MYTTQLRTALSTHIFRKGLRLSNAARQTRDTGTFCEILIPFFYYYHLIFLNKLLLVNIVFIRTEHLLRNI